MPVNLDIPQLEAPFVEGKDPHVSPLGVKGLGEIALVGMAPAVADAVFHATGQRVRTLPIRIEDVLVAQILTRRLIQLFMSARGPIEVAPRSVDERAKEICLTEAGAAR